MIDFFKKNKLFIKFILAVILGILFGTYLPQSFNIAIIESADFLQKLINFFVPLIIIGFVITGISSLENSSGKLLLITIGISYTFMLIGAFTSYFVTKNTFPIFLDNQNFTAIPFDLKYIPHFKLNLPPVMDVMTAIILAFIIGIGISKTKSNYLKNMFNEFHDIIELSVQKVIINIIPFYIVGVFTKMSSNGKIFSVLISFSKLIGIIFCLHLAILLFQYIIASIISKKNVFILLKNVTPAYLTAFATQSSVASIPLSLRCAKKNGVSDEISNFIVPLCSTIHLTGSSISIVANVIAVMIMNNKEIYFGDILPFILTLGIVMVAAPGVPCGAIFAVFPILESTLGFNKTMLDIIVALHIVQDGFGTACNVTGDGAISIIMENINRRLKL